jgi:hypothetical protein
MPVILATWEVEIRRIAVQGQLGQIVRTYPKNNHGKKNSRGVAQVRVHFTSKVRP